MRFDTPPRSTSREGASPPATISATRSPHGPFRGREGGRGLGTPRHDTGKIGNALRFLNALSPAASATGSPEKISAGTQHPTPGRSAATHPARKTAIPATIPAMKSAICSATAPAIAATPTGHVPLPSPRRGTLRRSAAEPVGAVLTASPTRQARSQGRSQPITARLARVKNDFSTRQKRKNAQKTTNATPALHSSHLHSRSTARSSAGCSRPVPLAGRTHTAQARHNGDWFLTIWQKCGILIRLINR